ncbi:ABC transporter permease [Sporosarcina pasteurii]|uniref:FtsX-like permease family n=1 Tax=Sporosarcina pasteurii TaxID=1474 RepID=A0A380BFL6_SPOPA|nr:ABC transporter permease [Sporosarcina pasteurii]MDS9470313.1 ABC transporter permease [Sporosarcina pasteurii]QBQ05973.1 FtsX-like permease family protein [Sporosarcina pasteurii]SUI99777.1 FtsX-like permease family [Sporosarcina pasteurii]
MTFRQFAYRNVVRNRRIYAAFFMASVFSVMVFFLYSMLLFHPTIEDKFVQEFAIVGMGIAEIILYIFTVFFLFYSMRAFLQARSREFGILLHLGMEKRQISRLIFLETMLIGTAAIGVGTGLGFTFSKFFFMIVREIVMLPSLPLYVSWKPFALTIGAFFSLFILISFIAPVFIKSGKIADLIRGERKDDNQYTYSKVRGYLGILLLGLSYVLATLTSNAIVLKLFILLPPIATLGTYFFFTDSAPLFLQRLRSSRRIYWQHSRLLSISSGIIRLRENARMFFIVTIVSTIAFMSVGTLASLTSFASQYRAMNPLGLVYVSHPENIEEAKHIAQLTHELNEEEIAYSLTKFKVIQQVSSFSDSTVNILSLDQVNQLANHLDHLSIHLDEGEALFLPQSNSSYKNLNERVVKTELGDSHVKVKIDGAYPYQLFPSYSIGSNVIVLNNRDYQRVVFSTLRGKDTSFNYYAFHIPEWQKTKDIGLSISDTVTESFLLESKGTLPYAFDNPGLSYSIIRMTFSLLLFIGLLLAGVFFLATGSFIYFQLYTSLAQERKKFDVLRRLGLTDYELKKIVNRQLIPQFFFPWGVAFLHSSFAFLSLQVIWDALAEISIVKELAIVLIGFTFMQWMYFYLIRWRYLVHIKASG